MASRCNPEAVPQPEHLMIWRIVLTAAILVAVALSNAFSQISNYARFGESLSPWKPLIWEFSSVILIGALIPLLAWLNRRVPLIGRHWYRRVPIHLLATLPFSILHVAGMVGLRKLAYAVAGGTYQFGPVLSGWVYEYRKDFVTYWILIAYLCLGSAWRYWRRMQAERPATEPVPAEPPASGAAILDRLVVRKLNREFILDVTDIARIESSGNYVTVHANAATYQLRGPLAGLSKRLDNRRFVQIHRSQIVNIDHVREIQPWDHGDYRVLLNDGSVINFSRRYRARLEKLFYSPGEDHRSSAARH